MQSLKQLLLTLIPILFSSTILSQTIIGTTTYDLQSNNSGCNRLVNLGNGDILGIWTRSVSYDIAANDRGTGYNRFSNSFWGAHPSARIESQRTGWPNIGVTRSGREFVVSHTVSSGIHFAWRNTIGSGSWNNKVLLGDPVAIWPRMANVGDTIYVITSRQTGDSFNGVDGAISLFRSWD